jgi:hypothetical protein
MNIAIIGATGRIGQRILSEAVARGHQVTALTTNPSKIPADAGKVSWKTANALDAESVSKATEDQDVLISAYAPPRSDPDEIVSVAKSLLTVAERHPALRLLIVGGAGSLEAEPGKTVIDAGMIPAEWIAIPAAHKKALDIYRANTSSDWSYFSPALMIQPGERTGKFRLGGEKLLVGANGKSEISMEDYAAAMLDEAEKPLHVRQRFTIGY